MSKTHDLCVKVGTYEKDSEIKNRYLNIGAVLKSEHGPYILLHKTFNPAGVVGDQDKESILISMFEKKEDDKKSETKASGDSW